MTNFPRRPSRLHRTGGDGRALVASIAAFLVLLAGDSPAFASTSAAASSSSSPSDASSGRGGSGLNFLAIGDWGGSEVWPYTTRAQIETASGMASVASSGRSAFVLALKDNFYSYGISGDAGGESARRRFDSTFERVYGQESLDIPWYVTAGNHDYLGNVTAQLAFHGADSRWVYPDLFHSVRKEFTVGGDAGDGADDDVGSSEKRGSKKKKKKKTMSLEIVLIDTVVLAGMHAKSDVSEAGYFDPLPGPSDPALAASYLKWIEARLSRSRADYLLVAGHYPIYSACRHGSTDYLIRNVDPMLRKHNVTAYLSGHEHCQLHIRRRGVDYLLTGTGDECCFEATNAEKLPHDADLRYLLSGDLNGGGVRGGFASFEAGSEKMAVRLHDEAGRILYATVLWPRRRRESGSGGSTTVFNPVGADGDQRLEDVEFVQK